MMKSVFGRLLLFPLACVALFAPGAWAVPTHEVVYSWDEVPDSPGGKLIQGTDGNFYGTAASSGDGAIFQVTPAGMARILVKFSENGVTNKGSGPNALVQGSDGNFYGTTIFGGANGYGTIFKMTSAGVLKTLVEFADDGVTNKGREPHAGLVQWSDGNFYGTTGAGGASGDGTIFKMTPAGVLTTLVEFTGNGATNKGFLPEAALIISSDGNFYGTTTGGGANNQGTIFKMTPAGVLTTLVEFTSDGAKNKGAGPYALVQAGNGLFYGTTYGGGANGFGTVFKMTPAGKLKTLVEFTGDGDGDKGAYPPAGLVQGGDGNFYGTTSYGGANNCGTVFKMTPTGKLKTLVEFNGYPGAKRGLAPDALMQGNDGNFYGVTTDDALYYEVGGGTVFRVTPTGAFTTLVQFAPNPKGADPWAGLVQGRDGDFYGTTRFGGKYDVGTVFKVSSDGAFTKLAEFTGFGASADGAFPVASLVQDNDGNFFGTTLAEGAFFDGTVFKMTPTGVVTTLAEFTGYGFFNRGSVPQEGLVLGDDGNFYGTTLGGGANAYGTIFTMTPAGALTTLVDFTGTYGLSRGSMPQGELLKASEGNFYGTTSSGGADGYGTVFEVSSGGALATLVDFTGNAGMNKGAEPTGALVRGSDGNIYGTTQAGGSKDCGTVFKMTPEGKLTTLVQFTGTTGLRKGSAPNGLMLRGDGNFYGTTNNGGAYNLGTVFQMTPAGVFTTLLEFTGNNGTHPGTHPYAGLVQGSDGNLYGTTSEGGTNGNGCGTVFRLRFGPMPQAQAASAVTSTTATLRGRIYPHGNATTVTFQYGTDATLAGATSVSAGTVPATATSQDFAQPIGGLTPGTKYYFCIAGQNAENTQPQQGRILSFTTAP